MDPIGLGIARRQLRVISRPLSEVESAAAILLVGNRVRWLELWAVDLFQDDQGAEDPARGVDPGDRDPDHGIHFTIAKLFTLSGERWAG